MQEASRLATSLDLTFATMSTKFADATTVLRATIVNNLHAALGDYLQINMTKAELTQRMLSYVISNAVTSVVATGTDFVTLSDEAVQDATLQVLALREAYTALYTLTLPVMSDANVRNMTYIQYILSARNDSNNTALTSFLADPLSATLQQVDEWFLHDFAGELTAVREELNSLLQQLADSASTLEERLYDYADNSRMNYNFYTSERNHPHHNNMFDLVYQT